MSLVGWWPLTGQAGDAPDYSGQGNHGTVSGPTRGVAAPSGITGYSFDGTDDYVDLDCIPLFTDTIGSGDFTISFWSKLNTSDDNYFIHFGDDTDFNEYAIFRPNDPSGDVYFRSGGSGTAGLFADRDFGGGELLHWTIVRKDTTAWLYLNSKEADTVTDTNVGTNFSGIDTTNIGGTPGRSFRDCFISDLRIYNRALTSAEIQTLYDWGNGDYARPNSDGISYYPLDGDGTDSWGSNDGTVSGAAFVDGVRGQAASFDGTDDYISFPSLGLSSGDAPLTVAMWVKFNAVNNGETESALWLRNSTDVIIRNEGSGSLIVYNNTFSASAAITSDTWYHVVLSRKSGSDATVYLNGISIKTGSPGSDSFGQENRFGQAYNGNQPFAGEIDDARFYGYALEPWEIHEIYRYGTRGVDLRDKLVRA